ncbi:MAG: riboflavin synthase [bacterium]
MFTGLIEDIGEIRNIIRQGDLYKLEIYSKKIISDVKIGDSIAVNGVCLTATSKNEDSFSVNFDVSPVTVRKTNISELKVSDKVNLERALRLSDRLGGHLVSGHIDCIGRVNKILKKSDELLIEIKIIEHILNYVTQRGSISINGISLTIVDYNKDSFTVSIIPHTARMTNLESIKLYASVNIEFDMIAKYLERLLGKAEGKGVSEEMLQRCGFV